MWRNLPANCDPLPRPAPAQTQASPKSATV
jgi:hypothetical protein